MDAAEAVIASKLEALRRELGERIRAEQTYQEERAERRHQREVVRQAEWEEFERQLREGQYPTRSMPMAGTGPLASVSGVYFTRLLDIDRLEAQVKLLQDLQKTLDEQRPVPAATNQEGPDDSEPTPERQAELQVAYVANVQAGKPPYAGVVIGSRSELAWILGERGWQTHDAATLSNMPDLRGTALRGDLQGVDLTLVNLSSAHIDGANLAGASLRLADLSGAHIDGANLAGADLGIANLSNAVVYYTDFRGADLEASNLRGALLSGDFGGVTFKRARVDAATVFGGEPGMDIVSIHLDAHIQLIDVSWNGAILARINWDEVPRLGDEAAIKTAANRAQRVAAYQNAARAYRELAKTLEAEGLTAPALRYRRRQHQLERAALLRDAKLGPWLFSGLLNLVSGYGDRPGRALACYLVVVGAFTGVYWAITNQVFGVSTSHSAHLAWYEALVLSISSFHGRGFFPSMLSLGDPIALVAAAEAIIGLFIELVFIATFTQRFFAR
jgi:hypothetical protein